MKISTKTYYAMRALVYLAEKKTPVSVREIAEQEDLPLEYLEKILQTLRKAHIVSSQRGVSGGYTLAYPAEEITLHDIFSELEGPFFSLPCLSASGCGRSGSCHTKDMLHILNKKLDSQLQKITLKNILSS